MLRPSVVLSVVELSDGVLLPNQDCLIRMEVVIYEMVKKTAFGKQTDKLSPILDLSHVGGKM